MNTDSIVNKALSRGSLEKFLERVLGVFTKHGFLLHHSEHSKTSLEEFLHHLQKSNLVDDKMLPWYPQRGADILERWMDGMVCKITHEVTRYVPLPTLGIVTSEKMRVMTYECAMVLCEYGVEDFCYTEPMNAFSMGLAEVLRAMNYKVNQCNPRPWYFDPEWEALKKACKNKE